MRVSLNINTGFRNFCAQKQTHAQFAPASSLARPKGDFITFSGTVKPETKPVVFAKKRSFEHIDSLLSEIKNNTPANEVSKQISHELHKVLNMEEKNIGLLAKGVKAKIDKEAEDIKKQYAAMVPKEGVRTIEERAASGYVTRKIVFENGYLTLIETEGPYSAKNIARFEKGHLEYYAEGYSKLEDGTITTETEIKYWPNGNVMHYTKNHWQKDLAETTEKDSFYDPDGKIGVYREFCRQYQYVTKSMEKYIWCKNSKLNYTKNYKLNKKNSSAEAEIKFLDGKLIQLELNGKSYL